jgi:hypothetical protein
VLRLPGGAPVRMAARHDNVVVIAAFGLRVEISLEGSFLLRQFPPVGIARPLVKNQHAREVMQIFRLAQLLVRQKIVQRHLARIAGIPHSKLRAWLARRSCTRQLHDKLRR